ncbi:hypothetical protein CN878_20805 [Ochrobactrum sp. 695/2009]|uniref:YrhK domain-containing protein n=1 Tax=Brucella intermedia TaxID=94625 RepID=A0A7V6P9U5_9HYPH|nr:hypothetical protein CN881_05135 [Ochrobactrum sp. 721/2009]PJT14654.1 hypothetical protein CN880_19415 [Ochrobactrum sp. 720/2009]PJT22180.1 hypothetical protein CN879_12875 [Ochrobactrum sp. 715/2009]PJT25201.1 hypothetical protein CN878_20805 [Ochrobactrum sp. 695/2009]PJT34448.1 hypothetical protein CN877_12915 [Ochrobactrum sp. 689/2009]HHV66948.1 hypothetical protein [Brucella intermedia]
MFDAGGGPLNSGIRIDRDGGDMSLIHNERTKLLANNLDRLSTAFLAVGVLGNTFSFTPGSGLVVFFLGVTAWILPAIGLHLAARRVLGRLRP